MLITIREHITGWIGWILLGLIIVTFSFFGLNWYFQSSGKTYAAKVNGVEIPVPELQRVYQQQRARMQQLLGKAFNPAMIDEAALRKAALDSLVREQLLLQEAERDGYAISGQMLAARIHAIPEFRSAGEFSMERYEQLLRQQGMSTAGFEWRLGREMMISQLVSGIVNTAGATEHDIANAYRLQEQTRKFDYVVLPVAKFEPDVKVSAEEIERYYDEHPEMFTEPERVKLQYVELDADNIDTGNTIDEETLRAYYREQSARFTTEERRRARHILIKVAPDADEASMEEARDRANRVLERLRAGEPFEDVAADVSEDPGSVSKGGDLGYFTKGVMTPPFEEVAFSLEKGQISGLVRTAFGYHIIEVTDIQAGHQKPLEEVREELVKELKSRDREEAFYDQSEQLANLTFENPDNLDVAADALKLEIQESGWLTREGGEGVGQYPQVLTAAFSQELIEEGLNSEPLEVAPDHLFVVRVLEHQEAQQKPLEAVRDRAEKALRTEIARRNTLERGKELMARITGGEKLADIAQESGLQMQSTDLITRTATEPRREIIHKAFMLERPKEEAGSSGGLALPSGDYVLITLREVNDGDISKLPDADRLAAQRELGSMYGSTEMAAFQQNLRQEAEIVIPSESPQ
jgi:peptidyl-prolyl cis-trans isomerase D